MATAKRKTCEDHETVSEEQVENKRAASMDDIPEALQLRILASLDAKQAVQTMILSRTWVSLWTRIPVLEFNYFSFKNLNVFKKFVNKVLRLRDQSAKLDTLKFIDNKTSSTKILNRLFDYAFSHGVNQLEASIYYIDGNNSWPVSVSECDSLTCLKLQSRCGQIKCPFLGPGSTSSFKNLTVLHLTGARITDIEPFSGFPMLESLTLLYCDLSKDRNNDNIDRTLRVYSPGLLHLTVSGCTNIKSCELRAPRLRFLEYRGFDFPKHDLGLSVLDTLVIDYRGFYHYSYIDKEEQKRLIEDLLFLFSSVHNVKSLTLFLPTVVLLLLFVDELKNRSSPFRELKKLKLDLRVSCRRTFVVLGKSANWEMVKDYLLQHFPDARLTQTNPRVFEWSAGDL